MLSQYIIQEGLAVASTAGDVGSSSTNRSSDIMHYQQIIKSDKCQHRSYINKTPFLFPACTVTTMRGKCGYEFETYINYNAPMHFRHRQTDTDIVA